MSSETPAIENAEPISKHVAGTGQSMQDFLNNFSSPKRANVFYCNIQNVIMDAQYILVDGDSLLVSYYSLHIYIVMETRAISSNIINFRSHFNLPFFLR